MIVSNQHNSNNSNNNNNHNNNNDSDNKYARTQNSRCHLARDIQPLCTKVKMHPKKITLSVTWVNNGYVPQGSRTNLGSENGLLDWQNF